MKGDNCYAKSNMLSKSNKTVRNYATKSPPRSRMNKRYFIAHFPNDPKYWEFYPNLVDGILMSQKNLNTKKGNPTKLMMKIEGIGAHKALKIPDNTQFMLDSGAYQYIGPQWDELPISPEKVMDTYRKLKVDIGVHLDWPIINGLNDTQIKKRYATTIENAEIMMKLFQRRGYNFELIGVTQGNSPVMYKRCAEIFIKLGYRYIGIGGLVPLSKNLTQHKEIINRVRAVTVVTAKYKNIKVHLFGLGSIKILKILLGDSITSFDNATPTLAAINGDLLLSNPYRRFNILRYPYKSDGFIPCGCPACNELGRDILKRGKRIWNFGRAVHNYFHYKYVLNGIVR